MMRSCKLISSGLECVLDPVDAPVAINRHDVEADRRLAELMDYDIVLGGGDDAGLLLPGDAGDGATVLLRLTVTDFDNCQRMAVAHYQIQLAQFAAEIAMQEL